MLIIMGKLQSEDGLAAVAVLRLVCKAWHAAFSGFPGAIVWQLLDSDDLTCLCNLLPAMASLEIHDVDHDTDFQPVSTCTNLTHLTLYGNPDATVVDLSLLPQSLKELTVDSILPYSQPLQNVSSLKLTKLEILGLPDEHDGAGLPWQLLPYLQDLKVYLLMREPSMMIIKNVR